MVDETGLEEEPLPPRVLRHLGGAIVDRQEDKGSRPCTVRGHDNQRQRHVVRRHTGTHLGIALIVRVAREDAQPIDDAHVLAPGQEKVSQLTADHIVDDSDEHCRAMRDPSSSATTKIMKQSQSVR